MREANRSKTISTHSTVALMAAEQRNKSVSAISDCLSLLLGMFEAPLMKEEQSENCTNAFTALLRSHETSLLCPLTS